MNLSFKDLRNSFSVATKGVESFGSNLIGIQKESYDQFLSSSTGDDVAMKNIFETVFPISDSYGCSTIEFVSYRQTEPKFTVEECKKKSLTYSSDIFVTVRLIIFNKDNETGVADISSIKEQEIYLCTIPLMTEHATFVVNGFERVIVSQIHRSPGVFFIRDMVDDLPVYSASIIPYRGAWLVMSFDARGSLFFRIDKKRKLPIYHLLVALGMGVQEMMEYFYRALKVKHDKKTNMFELNLDADAMAGRHAPFNVYNEAGDVIVTYDKIVNRKTIKDMKAAGRLFCKRESLEGAYLAKGVEYEGEELYPAASLVTDSMIESFSEIAKDGFYIIDQSIAGYSTKIISSIKANQSLTREQTLSAMFKVLNPGEIIPVAEFETRFNNLFFSKEYYDLFAVGRYKINTTFGFDESVTCTTLRQEDILLTVKKLIEYNETGAKTDDIDHLGNRRVRSVGELLENQFRIGLTRMARAVKEKLNTSQLDSALPADLIVPAQISKAIKDFFMTSQLSQFMDQTNPLAELAHKRRISSLGSGGLTRDRAGVEVRDVHPTHYGRVCTIETPEGFNIGLINSLATYSTINKYGFIETPYRKVSNCVMTDEIVFMDANKEFDKHICQFDRNIISGNKISKDLVSARNNGEFVMVESSRIQYMDVSPRQTISVVTALIPFLENDDAKRALMGSNMQRQAVPLIETQAPLIGTGMEHLVAVDSGAVIIAKKDGVVVRVDANSIVVRATNNGEMTSEIDTYVLRKFERSNNNTCINQIPVVSGGDLVKAGDVLADGQATSGGEIALGRNLLVAFVPWNGYNFEDSIVISEKVVHEEAFTSIHIEEFEATVRDTRLGIEEITRDIPSVSPESLNYLDETGIVHLGVSIKAGDILVGKVTPKSETPITPEEKLLRAIFGEKVAEVKDSSLRVPPGVTGSVVNVTILTKRGNEKDSRAKQIEQEDIIQEKKAHSYEMQAIDAFFSDELDALLLNKEVSYLGKGKKKIVETASKSVLAEMSVQMKLNVKCADSETDKKLQHMSSQYSNIAGEMEKKFISRIDRIREGDDLQPGVLKVVRVYLAVKSKLQPGDKMAGRHGNKGVVSRVVPVDDMPFMEDGTPMDIVLNPLGVPARMNIGQILETNLGWASHLIGKRIDEQLKAKKSISEVKNFLTDVLTDDALKQRLNDASPERLEQIIETYRSGVPFATHVFEGAKVADIERLFEKVGTNKSGQIVLYDGFTGERFDREVTVGYIYMLKLHHLVDNKIHARSTGPYSLVTQQPLGGKSQFGGQRFGEMECWALQSYGAAYTLQEMLTVKSDDTDGRNSMYESIVKGEMRFNCGIPESFNVLFKELRSLGFNVKLNQDS